MLNNSWLLLLFLEDTNMTFEGYYNLAGSRSNNCSIYWQRAKRRRLKKRGTNSVDPLWNRRTAKDQLSMSLSLNQHRLSDFVRLPLLGKQTLNSVRKVMWPWKVVNRLDPTIWWRRDRRFCVLVSVISIPSACLYVSSRFIVACSQVNRFYSPK